MPPGAKPIHAAHVSFFVDPAGRDGEALLEAWPTLARLGPAIAREDVRVTVVQAAADEWRTERNGVRYRFVEAKPPTRLQRRLGHWATPLSQSVVNAVLDLSPDIVHVHSLSFPRHVHAVRRAMPAARLIVQDHADRPLTGWRRRLVRARLPLLDAVSFTAGEQAEAFVRDGIIDAKTRVLAVPESSSEFTPGDRALARKLTGLQGDPCVLWVGHLNANKDPLLALDAVRIAVDRLPDARLYMAWLDAPLFDAVRQKVSKDERLRSRVTMLGPQPHERIQELLRSADLLIQASHREGSGYAVIEALATGTAPIVTDIPSFRALTGNGVAGALSPVGDAAAMSESLVKWASMPAEQRRHLVRDHFERNLSFAAIGACWRAAYRAIMGR